MKSNRITKAELNLVAEQMFISGAQGVLKRLAGNDEEFCYFNLFKYAFDSGQDAVAIFDLDGKIDFVNTTFYDLFKYQSREDLKGLKYSSFFPIREIGLLSNLLREPDSRNTLKLPEAQAINKDGKVMPVSLYAFEILNQAGQAIGLFCSIRDIAERKAAEQIAAKSEEKYRMLVENIHDVIYSLDADGTIYFITPNVYEWTGYSHKEMVGHNILEFIHPDDLRKTAQDFQKIVETGKEIPIITRIVTKNGETLDAEARGKVILDENGRLEKITGVIRDITERKRAEEAMRESEERYRLLAENATDVIWTMDLNLRFTYVSPSVLKSRGFTVEETMTQTMQEVMTPESLKNALEIFKQGMEYEELPGRDPKRVWLFEIEQPCKNGSTIWTETAASFLRDKNGQPKGILGVARNITERMAAEQEKEQMLLRMAQTDKLCSLGQFAAGMAHEINNPLAYVKANLKVLDEYRDNLQEILQAYEQLDKRFSGAELPENVRRFHNEITALRKKLKVSDILGDSRDLIAETQGGVDRIKNIVKSLQRFSDPPKMESEWADINSILENTLDLVGSEVMRKATLIKDLGELPRVKCHAEELSQVFINLISNALNAIKTQGEITVRSYSKGDIVVVKVKDTGTGMTPDQLSKIFDPFYSCQGVGKSTGLGLSISYGIIKKHRGEIKVESEPGKGSTFTIELPVGK